jgi:hypothetical protein
MSEESSGSSGCGCCGCFVFVVIFVTIVALMTGNFKVNGKAWNLDIIPPGLNSVEAEAVTEEPTPKTETMPNPSTDKPAETKEW